MTNIINTTGFVVSVDGQNVLAIDARGILQNGTNPAEIVVSIEEDPTTRDRSMDDHALVIEWKHHVGPAGHDWWEATCGVWRLAVVNSEVAGLWQWLVEFNYDAQPPPPSPLPSWSGVAAEPEEEGRLWALAEAVHALERALAYEGRSS
jgi:hypothetical protein